jgi:copper transport protein
MFVAANAATMLGWVGAAVLVGAEIVTGHTRTTDPAWLTWAADAVHVTGAAIWFGGLAAFAVTLHRRRREDDPVGAATTVGRFSTLAAWSVLGLTVAGGTLAWTQVRALHALTSTTYGWTLIAKVAVVTLVLLMALYNNRRLVPAVTRSGDDAPHAWAKLGRTVRWELAGIVLALGFTAMLVNIQPAAEAAGVSGAYSTFVPFGDGQVNLVVDPNRVGMNEIHIYLLTPGGLPAITEGGVTIEMSLPSEEVGPFVRETEFAGPGHFLHTGPELALPGTWEITVKQRISEFEEESVVIPVVVNG